jgi:glutathione S-transferase
MITISAFRWVPEFAYGQVRDLRARWSLEEAGIPYKTRLLEQGDQDKPDYRALQPFGQVPILQDGDFTLFESGAIVLHIGERSETLLPKDPFARARATQWLIAALNSIEPFLMNVALIDLFYTNEEWRSCGVLAPWTSRSGVSSAYPNRSAISPILTATASPPAIS